MTTSKSNKSQELTKKQKSRAKVFKIPLGEFTIDNVEISEINFKNKTIKFKVFNMRYKNSKILRSVERHKGQKDFATYLEGTCYIAKKLVAINRNFSMTPEQNEKVIASYGFFKNIYTKSLKAKLQKNFERKAKIKIKG